MKKLKDNIETIKIVVCLLPIIILCASLLYAIITGQVNTNNL